MTAKANQGMQRPSLGGIGSRFDVRRLTQVCSHNKPWRIAEGEKIICGICHPPAALTYEWVDGADVSA